MNSRVTKDPSSQKMEDGMTLIQENLHRIQSFLQQTTSKKLMARNPTG